MKTEDAGSIPARSDLQAEGLGPDSGTQGTRVVHPDSGLPGQTNGSPASSPQATRPRFDPPWPSGGVGRRRETSLKRHRKDAQPIACPARPDRRPSRRRALRAVGPYGPLFGCTKSEPPTPTPRERGPCGSEPRRLDRFATSGSASLMVSVVEWLNTPGCEPGEHRFKPGQTPLARAEAQGSFVAQLVRFQ